MKEWSNDYDYTAKLYLSNTHLLTIRYRGRGIEDLFDIKRMATLQTHRWLREEGYDTRHDRTFDRCRWKEVSKSEEWKKQKGAWVLALFRVYTGKYEQCQ